MRVFKFTFLLSIFVLLFSNQSKSMDNRCYVFIEGLKPYKELNHWLNLGDSELTSLIKKEILLFNSEWRAGEN